MANLNFKHLRYFWMVAKSGSIAARQQAPAPDAAIDQRPAGRAGGQPRRRAVSPGRARAGTDRDGAAHLQLRRRNLRARRRTAGGRPRPDGAEEPCRFGSASPIRCRNRWPIAWSSRRCASPNRCGSSAARAGWRRCWRRWRSIVSIMVIADRPMPTNLNVRGYSHFLGESDLTVFAAPDLARSLPGTLSRAAGPGAVSAAGGRRRRAARPRPLVRSAAPVPAHRRRVRRQRLAQVLRPGRRRPVRGAHGDCRLRVPAVRRPGGRAHRLGDRAALRHHHRAPADCIPPSSRWSRLRGARCSGGRGVTPRICRERRLSRSPGDFCIVEFPFQLHRRAQC
ncbi:MAG: hypothetical protein MZV63_40075 [Marinilabiliales bacterium]|nr:hypothetical protein [Marinilabiliales bacterium]